MAPEALRSLRACDLRGERARDGLRVVDPLFKRPFDWIGALLGLLILAPVLPLVSLAILLESGRPVLFRQERFGRNGRPFELYKFRTMVVDRANVEIQAIRGDGRITNVGRWLRRTGLDELPQLFNILRGDMSFVGPRPQPKRERVLVGSTLQEVEVALVPGADVRHKVRPGITGIAQVYAPRVVAHRKKFRYDAIYVRQFRMEHAPRCGARSLMKCAPARCARDVRLFWLDVRLILEAVRQAVWASREA